MGYSPRAAMSRARMRADKTATKAPPLGLGGVVVACGGLVVSVARGRAKAGRLAPLAPLSARLRLRRAMRAYRGGRERWSDVRRPARSRHAMSWCCNCLSCFNLPFAFVAKIATHAPEHNAHFSALRATASKQFMNKTHISPLHVVDHARHVACVFHCVP